MSIIYVLVADSSIAKLFSVEDNSGDLVLIENLVSPDARVQDQELQSDKPGRVFDIKGEGRHSNEGDRSPRQQAAVRFSSALSDRLKADLHSKLFRRLYVIAEPQFLGLLKKAMDSEVSSVLEDSIPKNLTRHDLDDIRNALPKRL